MKKKKILKISGIVLLVILGILIAIPFFLEGRIESILRKTVNNSIQGTFDFEKADLSLIRSFPNAELTVRNMYLVNEAPFEGDTLMKASRLSLTMGLGQLLKGTGEPIGVRSLDIDGALLNILINEEEQANYDIAKESGPGSDTASASGDGFRLDLQSYTLKESEIRYTDRAAGMSLVVAEIFHQGTGDLSLENSELKTRTDALVTFEMDSTNYLNRNKVHLEALLGINLPENKYSFLENEALINQLPLVFEGYVQVFEDYQDVNLQFRTPSSDFKNFLGLIPETYSKNIEGVQTSGNFEVEGSLNGRVDDTHIPQFSIQMTSENASFKYPDLPKSVENIQIDALVKNTTGLAEDTFVAINKASFTIDSDRFNMSARISELTGNTLVDAHLDGDLNLANLSAAYPVPADLNLKGRLKADINTAFDMASVEQKNYANTKTNGFFTLTNFEYASPELANPVGISAMTMEFTPQRVTLKELSGTTGRTDFQANGSLNNLLGFMFNKELVEGSFELSSRQFVLNDFMVSEESGSEEEGEASGGESGPKTGENQIKIPAFLDCTIQASAQTVIYDNLTLKDVSGTLRINNETATLSNLTTSLFGGQVALNGTVSTRDDDPTFSMKLGMEGLRISDTFASLDLLQALAPVAKALEGKFNSEIDISGLLTPDFTPDLTTISGDALASLLGAEIDPDNAPVLNALSNKLEFLNTADLDLGNLKTALTFEKGRVNIKPFTLAYKDIGIKVAGGHGFDRSMNYTASLEVPARYLGSEVNNLIARIDDSQLENLSIPITANIGGDFSNPTVNTDLTSGIKALTAQLVEIQKQKLLNQGKDKARDLIGGLLSGGAEKDTLASDSTKVTAKDVIGGILTNKKPASDSTVVQKDTTAQDQAKQAAKDILGGLFGKKKKAEEKKDSIN